MIVLVLTGAALLLGAGALAADAPAEGAAPADDAADAVAVEESATVEPPPRAVFPDHVVFPVSQFTVRYREPRPSLERFIEGVEEVQFELAVKDGVYFAPQNGAIPIPASTSLAELSDGRERRFHASALQLINERVLTVINERGLIGVVVDTDDISRELQDQRQAGDTRLTLLVSVVSISEVRTLASGDRVAPEERINHRVHQRIRANSPLSAGSADEPGDALTREDIDDYLFRLNRYAGRRVDAALSGASSDEVGSYISLDYLIHETKPFTAYFQLSNTGTEETSELRQRFGLIWNQPTNNDDTFTLDYVTAGFEDSHAVVAAYESAIGDSQVWRYAVHGSWSRFQSSEFGVADSGFEGQDFAFGGDLIFNFFQDRNLFLDLMAGVSYRQVEADIGTAADSGREGFILPHVGLRLERVGDVASTYGMIDLILNFRELSNNDADAEMRFLGRSDPDESFQILRYNLAQTFYLEPLLNRRAWEDVSDPAWSTLAHEVALGVRGQWAFNNRLIPQMLDVAGGLYTVRGYEEYEASGDNSVIASAEYRWHIPRSFAINSDPKPLFEGRRPFRMAPQAPYGSADWDFIIKTFIDVGRVTSNDRVRGETNQTLVGTGVGFEFVFKHNLRFDAAWGFALRDSEETDAGDSRFHFVLTVMY